MPAAPAAQQSVSRPALPPLPAPKPVVAYAPLPAPTRSFNPLLLVGLLGGGFLLAAVGVVVLVVVLHPRKKKEVQAAEPEARATTTQRPAATVPAEPRRSSDEEQPVRAPRIERGPASPVAVEDPPRRADPPPLPPEKKRLPPEEQQRVDKAIEKGLEYLSQHQNPGGRGNELGHAALTGLTMLECGVPADDPRVRRAANYVRAHAPNFQSHPVNYQISLALLFLDRLGDVQDEALIRNMGLRLVAGQTATGGWSYGLPVVQSGDQEKYFLTALRANRPRDASGRLVPIQDPVAREDPGRPAQPQLPATRSTNTGDRADPVGIAPGPLNRNPPPAEPDADAVRKALSALPQNLRNVPALVPPDQQKKMPMQDAQGPGPPVLTDNSNTQFATLALWVAGRHGVPIERSMALLGERFRVSQGKDGKWGYHFDNPDVVTAGGPGAMTGAGLLGLAVAHGVGPDRAPGDRKAEKDEHIQRGLQFFGQFVGKPLGVGRGKKKGSVNLYYLWTLERVAVIYRLETLNGQDWYLWGAELLVDNQEADGHWPASSYPGSEPVVDTCFALLFLKRANLAKDLSRKLEYIIEAKDPGSGR